MENENMIGDLNTIPNLSVRAKVAAMVAAGKTVHVIGVKLQTGSAIYWIDEEK